MDPLEELLSSVTCAPTQIILPYSQANLVKRDAELDIGDDILPRVEGFTISFHLQLNIDLRALAFKVKNAEYNPRKINSCVIRLKSPKCTVMIYAMGKVLVSGAQTYDIAFLAAKKIAKLITKCGFGEGKVTDIRIENMIATGDVKFPIRLEGIANEHRASSSYEPELFCGLVFRLFQPKVSALLFVTGKYTISGAKSEAEAREAFQLIYPVLEKYRK
jgi:transcription initiation factor TFIID TATA-box-binding protein